MRIRILISLLILSVCQPVFPQAKFSIDCQDQWGPGRFNKVTLGIDFTVSGFARFSQDFPVGLELINFEAGDCDVSWSDNQLSLVCMNAEAGRHVSLSYLVKPDDGMNGEITLQGTIVIISGKSVRNVVLMPEKTISIGGINGLLPSELADRKINYSGTAKTGSGTPLPGNDKEAFVYRIQLSSSSSPSAGQKIRKAAGLGNDIQIKVVKSGAVYKYQAGEFNNAVSAGKLLKELQERGLKDAFIIKVKREGN